MKIEEAKELGEKNAKEVILAMDKDVDLIAAVRSGFYSEISNFYEVERNRLNALEDQRKADKLADFDKRTSI